MGVLDRPGNLAKVTFGGMAIFPRIASCLPCPLEYSSHSGKIEERR